MVRFDFRKRTLGKASATTTTTTTTGARRRKDSNHAKKHRHHATEPQSNQRNNCLHRRVVRHLAAAPSQLIGLLLLLSTGFLEGAKRVAGIMANLQYSYFVSGGRSVLRMIVRTFDCLYNSLHLPTTGQWSMDTPAPSGTFEQRLNHQITDNHRRGPGSTKVRLGSCQTRYLRQFRDRSSEPAHYNVSSGCCVYGDGSPAPVPPGDCAGRIPRHYRDTHGPSAAAAAAQAWQSTQEWRLRNGVWKIHARPLLESRDSYRYPLYLHGRTKGGEYVLYEPTSQIDLKTVSGDTAAKADYLLRQFVSQLEYMGNALPRSDDGRATADTTTNGPGSSSSSSLWGFVYVMDVKGVGWSDLTAIAQLKVRALDLLARHYPKHCILVVVANVPSWLKAVAPPTLPSVERAGAQFSVWTESETCANLSALVGGLDKVPHELGGTSPYGLGRHPMDAAFQQLLLFGAPGGDTTVSDPMRRSVLPPSWNAGSMVPGPPLALSSEESDFSTSSAPSSGGAASWRRLSWATLLPPRFRKSRIPDVPRLYVVVRRTGVESVD